MNSLTKQSKFAFAVLLQVVILFTLILFKLTVLAGGTEVLLKIEPVDPTSPLRGDYATFQYSNISRVDSYLADVTQVSTGDTVYVVLRQVGTYWKAERVEKVKPTSGELFLAGKLVSGGVVQQPASTLLPRSLPQPLHIVYGIEEYFIPEGSGRDFSFFDKEAAARVVVDDEGNAVLKQILVGGKPWP